MPPVKDEKPSPSPKENPRTAGGGSSSVVGTGSEKRMADRPGGIDNRLMNKHRPPFGMGGSIGGRMMMGNQGGGRGVGIGGFDMKFKLGSTIDLPPSEPKKSMGRCRLFVGNLTTDMDEEEFRQMFSQFGEILEVFLNRQKGFGFVKMDSRQSAENAKSTLDGTMRKGRVLRVRFATHGAALKVRNLSPWVSNELLETAFSLFGEVERAVVIVDDRGRPMGEGIVEFARKPGAQMALKRCTDGCFLLCSSPRPVIVEPLEQKDEEDGLPEKNLPKTNQYVKEREIGPRFTPPGTFEYEFSNRWKQMYELEKQKREALEKEIRNDYERLEEQMEFAVYEQETNLLREKLRQREMDANNLIREREMRRREHEVRRQDEMLRHGGHQPDDGIGGRGDGMGRRQEDNLLMQANHLNDLLAQQEAAIRQMQGSGSGGNNMSMGGNNMNNNNNMGNQGFDSQGRSGSMGNAPPVCF